MNKPVKKPESQDVSSATQNFFEKYGKAATTHSIIGRLLKFNKFGEYRAGQEEEEIDVRHPHGGLHEFVVRRLPEVGRQSPSR